MENFQRKLLLAAFKLFDLLVMASMFVLAAAVVYLQNNSITFHEFLHMRFKVENYVIFSGFVLIWHLIFSGFGLYHSHRLSSLRIEIVDLLKAIVLGTLIILVSAWIFSITLNIYTIRFTQKAIQEIARWINNYPRRILDFMTPHALFTSELKAIS